MGTREDTKPWPKHYVFVPGEMERTECFYIKKKKKGVSYGTFIIVQLPCFESITAVQKALTYLQYTSISISWHLNDIRTPDSLK